MTDNKEDLQLDLEQAAEKQLADEEEVSIEVNEEPKEGETNEEMSNGEEEGRTQEVEAQARRMGWKPLEEFKGNKDDWIDANQFIEKTNTEVPVLKERLSFMDKRMAEMQETLLGTKDLMLKMRQKGYDDAKRDLEAEIARAKEDFDMEKYDKLVNEKIELEKESGVAEQKKNTQPKSDPVLEIWVKDPKNKWFFEEPAMQQDAIEYYASLERDHPYMNSIDMIKGTEEYIKGRFPQKFGVKQKQSYSDVESSNVTTSPKTGRKSYNDIPSEDRKIIDHMLRESPFYGKKDAESQKKMRQYKEEYLKSYFGS